MGRRWRSILRLWNEAPFGNENRETRLGNVAGKDGNIADQGRFDLSQVRAKGARP